jgi:Mrp family chromosome partitioning ATPase
MVTTPHLVSLDDVEKSINMAKQLKIRVLGIIENMSGMICPKCETEIPLFGNGGGAEIASKTQIPLLGSIPIYVEPEGEENRLLIENNESEASKRMLTIVDKLEDLIMKRE